MQLLLRDAYVLKTEWLIHNSSATPLYAILLLYEHLLLWTVQINYKTEYILHLH